MIKPNRLKDGDTIGIVAPATWEYKNTALEGIEKLKSWGFEVILGESIWERHGYLAGTDMMRARDFNNMFKRSDVDAVFCLRGGYGSGRILPLLDYDAIAENPKIFLGSSDITSLHLALQKKSNLVTFYGPSVAKFGAKMTKYSHRYLKKSLMDNNPIGEIQRAENDGPWMYTITPGRAEGQIVGGCLALIVALLGTPYEIDTAGKLFFIEDVREEPWIIDGYLNHLKLAGKLQQVNGIIIGEFFDCEVTKHKSTFPAGSLTMYDVLDEFIAPLNIPSFYGLPLGHGTDLATIPLGVLASMDAGQLNLEIQECGTTVR